MDGSADDYFMDLVIVLLVILILLLLISRSIDRTNSLTTFNQVDTGTPLQLKMNNIDMFLSILTTFMFQKVSMIAKSGIYLVVDDYNVIQ